jgi:hypothetical protein
MVAGEVTIKSSQVDRLTLINSLNKLEFDINAAIETAKAAGLHGVECKLEEVRRDIYALIGRNAITVRTGL